MNPTVLFIITGDPRVSPRPAEAIRIAAGVGTWRKTEVRIHLRDAAVLALGESVEDLVDDDNFARYLPLIGEMGHSILVQQGAPWLAKLGASSLRFEAIDDGQLAAFAAQCHSVLRF